VAGRHARDYYEASAPPRCHPPARNSPPPAQAGRHGSDTAVVPTFTQQSIGQGGAQLYSGSIATATPQTFTMASPPSELNGFRADEPRPQSGTGRRRHALHTGPNPPGKSRHRCYGASNTGSQNVAPSGLASRACAVWQCQRIPLPSGPLAVLPGVPPLGLPSGLDAPLGFDVVGRV